MLLQIREGLLRSSVDVDAIGVAFATLADGLVDQRSLSPNLDSEAIMREFLRSILVTTP